MEGSAQKNGDYNAAENRKTDDSVADESGIIGERADHEKYENPAENQMECTNKASAKDQVSKKKEKKKKKDDGEETSIFDLLSPPSV